MHSKKLMVISNQKYAFAKNLTGDSTKFVKVDEREKSCNDSPHCISGHTSKLEHLIKTRNKESWCK